MKGYKGFDKDFKCRDLQRVRNFSIKVVNTGANPDAQQPHSVRFGAEVHRKETRFNPPGIERIDSISPLHYDCNCRVS